MNELERILTEYLFGLSIIALVVPGLWSLSVISLALLNVWRDSHDRE